MTIVELLSDLRAREVNLWLDGGKLRFDAPTAALTDSLRQELARRKGEIVAFLRPAGVLASHTGSLKSGTPFRGWSLRSRHTQNKMTEQSETTEAPLSLFRSFLFGERPLRVEVYEVPGHHDTIVQEPRIRNLASQLSRCPQKVQQKEATFGSDSGRGIS